MTVLVVLVVLVDVKDLVKVMYVVHVLIHVNLDAQQVVKMVAKDVIVDVHLDVMDAKMIQAHVVMLHVTKVEMIVETTVEMTAKKEKKMQYDQAVGIQTQADMVKTLQQIRVVRQADMMEKIMVKLLKHG